MFFYLSKIFWALAAPLNFFFLLTAIAVAGLFTRWRKGARALLVALVAGFAVMAYAPVGMAMLRVLEDRFPRPAEPLEAPTGVIVLGGGVGPTVSHYRGTAELTDAGGRMTEAAMLAHRFPDMRVVFTGGSAALLGSSLREADVARRLFLGLGLAPERLVFEDASRNTYENAIFTRKLLQPRPGERWLLLTSAFHMPRSMGVFRKAGFEVIPYPVDYASTGQAGDYAPSSESMENLRRFQRAVREWIGLAAYRATGRTDALFPAP